MIIDVVSMAMVIARAAWPICSSSLRVVAFILQVSRLYLTPINSYCKNTPIFPRNVTIFAPSVVLR